MQKLRSENERLRAGAAESTQLSASRQDARKAQNEANALREQLALAKQQASGATDAGVRLARERDTVAGLRAKLKGATDEKAQLRARADELASELEVARAEAAAAASRGGGSLAWLGVACVILGAACWFVVG